jgi:CheY-like chemotaxis protein
VTSDSLPEVEADASQLTLVFRHLVENAIKFRAEDRPPEVRVSAETSETGLRLSVSDNGIGIDPQYAPRLFKIFQRLNGAKYPGAGIGLAICREIVERHGGRIGFDSEPGRGSRFHFTLPGIAAEPVAVPRAKPLLLVVDDEKSVRTLVRRLVEDLDVDVVEAGGREDALRLARERRPNLMLLDVQLGADDGLAVYDELQRDSATRDIPVLFLTGWTEAHERLRSRGLEFLPKPLPTQEFMERLRKVST